MDVRDRLESDDEETRLAAVTELYRLAEDDPESVRAYSPLLVEFTAGDVGHYARATLNRLVTADVLDDRADVAAMQSAFGDYENALRSLVPWVGDRTAETPTETELRRAARLFAWIAKGHPGLNADEVEILLAALERDPTRPGAIEALFHLSSRYGASLDVPVDRIVPHLDEDDPSVRGDAVGIIGQIAGFHFEAAYPHLSELIRRTTDPNAAVRRTAMNVLGRRSEQWTHHLPATRLHAAIEQVERIRTEPPGPEVRSWAGSFYRDLAFAVLAALVKSALAVDGEISRTAEDELVRVGGEDVEIAFRIAENVAYRARSADADETRRDDILDRIATRYPDRFESGADLLNQVPDDGARIPVERHDLIVDLASTYRALETE